MAFRDMWQGLTGQTALTGLYKGSAIVFDNYYYFQYV